MRTEIDQSRIDRTITCVNYLYEHSAVQKFLLKNAKFSAFFCAKHLTLYLVGFSSTVYRPTCFITCDWSSSACIDAKSQWICHAPFCDMVLTYVFRYLACESPEHILEVYTLAASLEHKDKGFNCARLEQFVSRLKQRKEKVYSYTHAFYK